MTYNDIINSSIAVGYNLERVPEHSYSIRKAGRQFPVSISEKEFLKLSDAARSCTNCLEISTGTGISSIALSSCTGSVLTIDSYAEEMYNSYNAYKDKQVINNNSSDFNMIKLMHDNLGIKNIFCEVGFSPNDIDSIVTKIFGDKKIDLLFIDSGHFDYQLLADFYGAEKYLSKNFKLFIHDYHCFNSSIKDIEAHTNRRFVIVDGCSIGNQAWNLAELI